MLPAALLGPLLFAVASASLLPRAAAVLLAVTAALAVRLYPRKTIDLGWGDLAAALWYSGKEKESRRSLEGSIAGAWSPRGDAVVHLSVRTGLDLLLRALELPRGSEVLFVPGITIPGMVEVVEANGLVAVGVDPPSESRLLVDELAPYLTEGTRVLVVTHLFGTVFEASALIREAKESAASSSSRTARRPSWAPPRLR
ncbi:unnamed protein product [Prorocentrum cordatum]|uniref:AMP-dependent synthetase/ligase domain-containing protein n=1 Tax=Prorocentrum cordatum TaxID=2364126 RepID=A0ABN9RIY6_9DINO|nr:unnamed protein product [Polarella glacialis]